MNWLSEIATLILGGGLVTIIGGIVGVLTVRSKIAQARAEADQAKADAERAKAEAEALRITNAENATRILIENIVKPLKEELNATQNALQAIRREVERLRKALEAVKDCPHARDCPVMRWLRGIEKGDAEDGSELLHGTLGLGGNRNKADP